MEIESSSEKPWKISIALHVLQDSDPEPPFRVAAGGEEAARRGSWARHPRSGDGEARWPLGAVGPAPEGEGQEKQPTTAIPVRRRYPFAGNRKL